MDGAGETLGRLVRLVDCDVSVICRLAMVLVFL